MARVEIRGTPLGPFETNCWVVRDALDATRGCWIVDPGAMPRPVIEAVRSGGLVPSAILLTHAHADHIAGVEEVRAAFPGVPVLLHRAEHAFLGDPQLHLSAFVGVPVSVGAADGALEPGAELAPVLTCALSTGLVAALSLQVPTPTQATFMRTTYTAQMDHRNRDYKFGMAIECYD